jgi:hypothetical protein
MCQNRFYPTPKVKCSPSIILLGLNAPPSRWCTLQQVVIPMLPLPRWFVIQVSMQGAPPLNMCHMFSHAVNATLKCANVVTKLQLSLPTYVSNSIKNLYQVCSSTQVSSSQVSNLQGIYHMVPSSKGKTPSSRCPTPPR